MATLNFGLIFSHPKEFIEGFSYYYPVPEYLLAKYEEVWDWDCLSKNTTIQWNADLLEKFQHSWNWKYNGLSNNKSIPWSPELLEQFKDRWSWYHLGWQEGIINHPDMLPMCLAHWNDWHQKHLFRTYGATIDKQHSPWAEKVFENWPALNWELLSTYRKFPWTEDFIRRHTDKLDWKELSWNTGLPWNSEFIREYLHKWNWVHLSVCRNIPWNLEMINAFKDYVNWFCLSRNESVQWSNDILITFKDQLHWATTQIEPGGYIGYIEGLYDNSAIVWTPELYEVLNEAIENQFKRLAEEEKELLKESNFVVLEENEHWTVYQDGTNWVEPYMEMLIDLSKQFPDKTFISWDLIGWDFKDWESYSKETIDYCKTQISLDALTQNPHFPWHQHPDVFNRLAAYEKDWKGWDYLSDNKGLKLTEEIIDQYADKWNWKSLSRNPSLTPTLIKRYKDQIDWREICDNPVFTPDIIEAYPEQIDWNSWWWKNCNHQPFASYNNFAQLLHIPIDEKIEHWINHNLLEEVLIKIVNQPDNIYRGNFKEALKKGNFNKLTPGITHEKYYPLLLEYAKEIIERPQSISLVEKLANKALKLLLRKRYTESIELFKLALLIRPETKVQDLSLYCNALYVLQNDNTGLPINEELNHLFLEKCLPYGPKNPAIYFNAACLYAEMKDLDKVYECIQLAKKHNYVGYDSMINEIKNASIFEEVVRDIRFKNL